LTRGKQSQPPHERTEEERERERAERARRRAERMGATDPQAPAEPSPTAVPAPAPEPGQIPAGQAEPTPTEPTPPEPTPTEPTPTEPTPTEPVHQEPVHLEPAPQEEAPQAHSDDPVQVQSEGEVGEAPQAPQPGEVQSVPAEPEVIAGPPTPPPVEHSSEPRPTSPRAMRRSSSRSGSLARAGRPRASRPRRGGRTPAARVLALVALGGVVAAIVFLVKLLVDSGQEKKVAPPTVVKVVIPEGSTRLQIALIAAADGLTGSYRDASKRSPLLKPAHYGAPSRTHDLEGFLFPATYEMYPHAPVSRLVQEQLIAFRENFASHETARARALHVTPFGLLTIASMIEREAKVSVDRPKIAAVIYNRLRLGIPLGIDATIYYALERQKGIPTYTHELTEAQLHLTSAYNTRIHTGLPPTPISNPGLASIEAAADPAHVSYLYYVLAADGCGEHVFSSTLAQFEADAAAYHAAVVKNGGAPPTCKK